MSTNRFGPTWGEVVAVRILALVLGLAGGLLGLFCGVDLLITCPLRPAGAEGMRELMGRGYAASLLSIAAIVGWVLAAGGLKLGGRLMLIAGILGLIVAFPVYLVPGALLIVGGVLTLVAGKPQPESGQARSGRVWGM